MTDITDAHDIGALTRLTVNLNAKAHQALVDAAYVTGDSKTDTVNRALIMYEGIVKGVEEHAAALVYEQRPGDGLNVRIILPAGQRKIAHWLRVSIFAAAVAVFAAIVLALPLTTDRQIIIGALLLLPIGGTLAMLLAAYERRRRR